jgi:hypothetical protein
MTINDILNQLNVATNASFMGLAYPSTVPPTPGSGVKVFYIAAQSGTYTSFNNITVASNDGLVLLVYNAGWIKSNAQIDQSFYSALNTYITETNGADFSVAGYITASNGVLVTGVPAVGRNCTDFIRISLTKNITFLGESDNQYINALSFYDGNKVFISGISNVNTYPNPTPQTVLAANIPTNAVYIRASTRDGIVSPYVKYGGIQSPLQAVETLMLSKTSQSSIETKYGKVPKRIGKNLFDYTTITPNKYLDLGGNLYTYNGYFASDFIPVLPSTNYAVTNIGNNGGGASNVFYTNQQIVISGIGANSFTYFTTPANCYFVRLTGGDLSIVQTAQLEAGTVATAFIPYIEYTPLSNLSASTTASLNLKLDKVYGKNLFNPNDPNILVGYYMDDVGNVYSTSYNINITGYIPISAGQTLTCNFGVGNVWGALYTIDKSYIPGSSFQTTTTYVAGAAFARWSYYTPWNNYQIEVGTTPTYFEPFTDYAPVGQLQAQFPDRLTVTILPSVMYFVKNKQLSVYYENVLFKNLNDATTLYCDKGINYNRQVTFNFTAAATNQTMTYQVVRNFKKGQLKTITYNVVDGTTNNGKTKNILCIGDSFTDIGVYVKELKTLLTTDGVTVNQIGTNGTTVGPVQYKAEGLSGGNLGNTFLNSSAGVARIVAVTGMTTIPPSGYPGAIYKDTNNTQWTIRGGKINGSGTGYIRVTRYGAVNSDFNGFPNSGTLTYVGGTTGGDNVINYTNGNTIPAYYNPFINHSTGVLDIQNYITFWGFNAPDVVVFQFTWNDTGLWSTDSALNDLVANFKLAADHVHLKYPSAKVIISIEPYGSINGNYEWNGKKYTVLRLTELLLAQFEANSSYNTWTKIAPSYAHVDLIYGYGGDTYNVTPNSRYPNVNEPAGGDGVHPNTGMLQIADCLYSIASHLI